MTAAEAGKLSGNSLFDTESHLEKPHGGSLPYIPAVDGMRAVAVVSVILYHLRAAILPGGFVGVDIFFVISGFVVTGSLLGYRPSRSIDLFLYFYARRIMRIAPALIVSMLLTALFASMFIPSAWLSDSMDRVGRAAFIGFSNVILANQSDAYFSPRAEFNPYLHTWSLGVEEQFYFVFPFLLLLERYFARRGKAVAGTAILAVLMLISLGMSAALTAYKPQYAFYMMPPRFWELGAGMALCLSLAWWRPRMKNLGNGGEAAFGIVAIGSLTLCFAKPDIAAFPFPMAALPVLSSVLLITLVASKANGIVARMLGSSAVVAIGKRSYSLYLWHYPVFVLFRWTIGSDTIASATAALMIVTALGWLSYNFVEQRVRRNRWISTRHPTVIVGAGLCILMASTITSIAIMKSRSMLSQSVTADTYLWYATEDRALNSDLTRCALRKSERPVATGTIKSWTPYQCSGVASQRRLFAIGDSHTLAYIPMLRQYAASTATPIQTYFSTGCPFLGLRSPMASNPACQQYYATALSQLVKELKPGDVVFLASLRLPRFVDQWGGTDGTQTADTNIDSTTSQESEEILRRLAATGATIVFEAPLPIFRSPPFRCSDWFNRMNPVCRDGNVLSRAKLATLRQPVLDEMQKLAIRIPSIKIWDPVPSLCNPTHCSTSTSHGPLFFDADHISGMGNDQVYPSFFHFMNSQMPN